MGVFFALDRFDLKTLPVDFVECLMRFLPTENEVKMLRLYERERKPLENLSDEDRFMMQFSKIERLMQKMTIMAFIGNFAESIQMLTPVSELRSLELSQNGTRIGILRIVLICVLYCCSIVALIIFRSGQKFSPDKFLLIFPNLPLLAS